MKVEEVGERSQEEVLDQSAYANINAEWVNRKGIRAFVRKIDGCVFLTRSRALLKGAWIIHPLLIVTGKVVIDAVPGMTQEASWTFVNMAYLAVSTTSV